VQYLVGHADPRTTRRYDRRKKAVTRTLVEEITD
jgi:integrase/recombinase XerD